MTPAARVQAAIEIVDEVLAAARSGGAAADTIAARYFKARRYAGSGDRRAIRELAFRAIRAFSDPGSGRAALIGLASDEPEIAALFDGSPHGPEPLRADEQGAERQAVPSWLQSRFDPIVAAAEHDSLLDRAPLDVRVNTLRGSLADARSLLPEAVTSPHSLIGLRLAEGFDLQAHPAWLSGLVEIQDEGSQLLCLGCEAAPGMRVVDLCAGAGGKTLAIAAQMDNRGVIVASDTDRSRLARLGPRADRAGVIIAETRLLDPGREREALADLDGQADLVFVDAPCSGSGTWRRNPETRWRLTPDRLRKLVELQARLLDLAAGLVGPRGRLVYAVCSLLAEEGRNQADDFGRRSSMVSQQHSMPTGRPAGCGTLLSPAVDGTDGFFVAQWRRP